MLFDWLQKNRRLVYVCFLIFVLSAVAGAARIQTTPDNRVFYGPNNTQFNEVLDFEASYTSNNNILFVLNFAEKIGASEHSEALRWLTDEAWKIQNVIRVDSLATYPYVHSNGDDISVENILDFYCLPQRQCAPGLHDYVQDSHLTNRLVSQDLESVGIVATLNLDIGSIGVVETISKQADELAERFSEKYPNIEVVMTGGIPMMIAFATSSDKDLSVLLPTALILISAMLFLFFGGAKPALTLVGLSLISALSALGIAGWLGHTVNAATAITPLVIFTIVTASSMHIVLHFLRNSEGRTNLEDIKADAKAALESNLDPMLVSAFTSIAGLLSLSFVDSPPLQQLGQISALGTLIGLLLAILILPLTMSRYRSGYYSPARSFIQQSLNSYARQIELQNTKALACFAFLLLLLLGFFRLEINDDFVDYFDHDTRFRVETDRATELLSGPNHVEVLLENPNEEGVFAPKYVQYLGELTAFLKSQPSASSVSSYLDILHELSVAFAIPLDQVTSADQFAQWYLVYELSLQRGQSNTDFIRSDQKQSRVSVLLTRTTSNQIKALEQDIYEWHINRDSGYRISVTGENIPVAHLSEINILSMISGLSASILLIAILIGVLVRKIRLGLVALTGTLAPLLLGFGAWGLFGFNIGLASTAIIAVTIGVVIDDAVHMLYRFIDGRDRLGLDKWHAAAYAVHRAGTAVATTSAVMIVGLSVLLLSSFKVNSSFGAVTCLIISVALIFDILVLPRLLVWADTSPEGRTTE